MADINFVIPHAKNNLLDESGDQYSVREIIGSKEIIHKLKGKYLFISFFLYECSQAISFSIIGDTHINCFCGKHQKI